VFVAPRSAASAAPSVRCREWERALRRRHPAMVLVGPGGIVSEAPQIEWLRRSPSLRPVVRHRQSVLFRVRGPIRLDCPAG
jgi:hypothetical protein